MSGKSKHGCGTCRRRRVKCDEAMPICQRCLSTGRHCDGPSRNKFVYVSSASERHNALVHSTRTNRLPRPCAAIPNLDSFEARMFDHFRDRVAPALGEGLDASFWGAMLPQISHDNLTIRYAVLAISQLYEQPPSRVWAPVATQDATHRLALKWYIRSLSGFSSNSPDPETLVDYQLALMSCLLFTTIEFQQNNVLNACALLQRGFSIIKEAYAKIKDGCLPPDSVLDTLAQMFVRQRFLMTIFGYRPPDDVQDILTIPARRSTWPSKPLDRAREELFKCQYDAMNLVAEARIAEVQKFRDQKHDLIVRQMLILANLNQWQDNLALILGAGHAKRTPREDIATNMLRVYYHTAVFWVQNCLQSEALTDMHSYHFENIVQLSEQIIHLRQKQTTSSTPFSFELGTIAPLFLTGWKCRDPALRRKALQLLHESPEQEALFSAPLHAKVVAKIIDMEEACGQVSAIGGTDQEAFIPPNCRIRNITVSHESGDGKKIEPTLIYDVQNCGTTQELTEIERRIKLE